LITQLEPEVLVYAEKQGLSQRYEKLLTHSQLPKALDEKSDDPVEKKQFKKYLANRKLEEDRFKSLR
jgi:hypothetical protein